MSDFLWNAIHGDKYIQSHINKFSGGRTLEEFETHLMVVMDQKIEIFVSAKDVNKKFSEYDNKLGHLEKTMEQIWNRNENISKEIHNIVQEEISDMDIPVSNVDEKKTVETIEVAFKSRYSQLCEKNDALENRVSELEKICAQNQNNIYLLNNSLETEKKRNVYLENYIKKIDAERNESVKLVHDLKKEFELLKRRLETLEMDSTDSGHKEETVPVQLPEREYAVTSEPELKLKKDTDKAKVLFSSDNRESNIQALIKIYNNTEELQNAIEKTDLKENNEIILKLTQKCKEKMEKLMNDAISSAYGPEKIASTVSKILKQTVIKMLSQSEIKDQVEKYLATCGVDKIECMVGKKMEDDDYNYLGDVFYEDVSDEKLDQTVTKIEKNAYTIRYEEDGDISEEIIPGIYFIGRHRRVGQEEN